MASQRNSAIAPVDPLRSHGPYISDEKASGTTSATDFGYDKKEKGGAFVDELPVPPPAYSSASSEGEPEFTVPAATAKDLVTEVLHVDDDPSLNPWTFRVWFLGAGLSTFGGILSTIYYFKPQTVTVSVVFLAVISYVLGEFMALVIPRKGFVGKWFNPHPFNSKEHAAIVIMSASAANCPLAIEALAVQRLWYDEYPNAAICIFLIISSQFLGYGIAGLMRKTLVYPTKMLFPSNLPINSLLESLHRDKKETFNKLRLFWWTFGALFVWEVMPEYIMPILTGVSIFCLAKRDSLVFTRLFGGANGNEGLGFLSICLDWQYIGGGVSPLWFPLQTLVNQTFGYFLCMIVFMGVFYMNIWRARDFPFLSQMLFSGNSNSTYYETFNQTSILGADRTVDRSLLEQQGIPYFATTYAVSVLVWGMAITGTLTHMFLWNYHDIKSAWSFASWSNIKLLLDPHSWDFRSWRKGESRQHDETDPHYRLMAVYKESPDWWYGLCLVFSFAVGLGMLYAADTTLPWYGYIVACLLSAILILFFGAQYAITGFTFTIQPIVQMIGGYMHPGKPVANMYFVLFGYNSVSQAMLLLKDLKFAQYAHLSPRCTFTMQMVGTLIGSIFGYVMMDQITTNQREILLSIEGTNVWSGQVVQSYNSMAIAWGGLAREMFSVGGRYQWITLCYLIGFLIPLPTYFLHKRFPKARFDYWNVPMITSYIGYLCVGINSSLLVYLVLGYFSQFYLRKYKPNWFIKYNYILSAALDGGTQVVVFILTFAVFGGAGKEVNFPPYWGNNFQQGNYDYCLRDPAN
ncbi:OPT superfamily oligopeptide transporter [Aulographum hederae CBS 113979]|uniref:OPT superfamily oligopeptide transporter n=1 Tax=Aulographum hederae CBS 113979 TaxID=1176131 RepID=A0A6G1H0F7_9PEZI|nr:OPT superfamily oligopeptide transporter [Aulographum hederae CBS 113979]